MNIGAKMILVERRRQIEQEGFTPDHDDRHIYGQIAWAAVCYAAPGLVYCRNRSSYQGRPTYMFCDPWPWDPYDDKRGEHCRIRQLVIAGALIAAEIDRLNRKGE